MEQDISSGRKQQGGRGDNAREQGRPRLFDRLVAGFRRWGAWGFREFGDTMACLLCVYLGVLTTMVVPSSASLLVGAPGQLTLTIASFVALPMALEITHNKGIKKWRSSSGRLGEKMLAAITLGITWGKR